MTRLPKFQQKQCLKILNKLLEKSISKPFQQNLSENFMLPEPINVYLGKPIDLLTIRENLKNDQYKSIQDWICDVFLVFDNALSLFNSGSPINAIAKDLRNWFEKKVKNFPRTSNELWLIEFTSTHEKLQKLVDSYPKPKAGASHRLREEESQSYQQSPHHVKNDSPNNHKITKPPNLNKVSLFDNDELEDDLEDDDGQKNYHSSNYKAESNVIVADDPRKREKKKIESVQLFPDLD